MKKLNLQARTFCGCLLLTGLVALNGCASPSPVERFLFTVQTNTVPVVTNWVATVNTTNEATGVVTVDNVVNWRTNTTTELIYTVSTNAAAIAHTAGNVTGLFVPGLGEIVSAGIMGLLAIWGAIRSRRATKMTTGATVLTQSIEVLLSIIETTPQGKLLGDRLKLELSRHQNAAGVLTEIASLVEATVDNDAAKKTARLILDTLPRQGSL